MRHERSRLSVAVSSASRPVSRAPTTRKWRGRKSSTVLPSRYCSTTAGLTYDERATAGVLPSFARPSASRRRSPSWAVGLSFEALLGELERGGERAAPGPEVLGREFLAHVFPDVVVQPAALEVAVAPVGLELEDARSPARRAARASLPRARGRRSRCGSYTWCLPRYLKEIRDAAHRHVPLGDRRDPEGARGLCVAVGADAEPAEVDQPDRDRRDPLGGQPSSSMCSAIASRSCGRRSAKRISLSYFACSWRARKSGW